MAETLKIPNKVINSAWQDDIDVDYATYGDNEKEEMEYISKRKIGSKVLASITEIKKKDQRIGIKALFKPGDKLAA